MMPALQMIPSSSKPWRFTLSTQLRTLFGSLSSQASGTLLPGSAAQARSALASVRAVPLWPQLRPILQERIFGGEQPRTEGLLFPAAAGGRANDLRKSLDELATMCGMEEGEVRTRRFRHTYCSARLQTVQRILKPGGDPADQSAWEYIEDLIREVAEEVGCQSPEPRYAGRPTSASTATGLLERHEAERAELLDDALTVGKPRLARLAYRRARAKSAP